MSALVTELDTLPHIFQADEHYGYEGDFVVYLESDVRYKKRDELDRQQVREWVDAALRVEFFAQRLGEYAAGFSVVEIGFDQEAAEHRRHVIGAIDTVKSAMIDGFKSGIKLIEGSPNG